MLKAVLFPLLLALVLIFPFTSSSQTLDNIKKQIVPDDVAERPPEVQYRDDFEKDIFNRENFYDKSAGTRQYRREMMAPTKSMEFEVINPADQNVEDEGPTPQTKVVEKNGKAVTVISIGEGDEKSE